MRRTIYCFAMILCFVTSKVSAADTTLVLQSLFNTLKNLDEISFEYYMDAKFHNGNKDRVQGTVYMNLKNKMYLNDCNEFTMVYTHHWFYRADHNYQTITLIDLQKEKDRKLFKEREKNIFENGALASFLDSVVLKKGRVKQLKYDGSICSIAFALPETAGVTGMTITYDTVSKMPLSCEMTSVRTLSTFDGMKNVNVNIGNSNFQKVTDNSRYGTDNFFTCSKNGDIKLRKYENYKLLRR